MLCCAVLCCAVLCCAIMACQPINTPSTHAATRAFTGLRPTKMGFRTWNQFGLRVNSSMMISVFTAMVRRSVVGILGHVTDFYTVTCIPPTPARMHARTHAHPFPRLREQQLALTRPHARATVADVQAARTRTVNGKPTSLVDLGFTHAGIDDGWQKCGSGPSSNGFHNASGFPIVDTSKFPSMQDLTTHARSLNITPGWYGAYRFASQKITRCVSI